jgi:chromosome partitioning protein
MDLVVLIDTIKKSVTPLVTPHSVLLTKVDIRSFTEAQQKITLVQLGIPACNNLIRADKAHEGAALAGMAITQWQRNNAREAKSDYRCFADEFKHD